jgi:hypothetical protein
MLDLFGSAPPLSKYNINFGWTPVIVAIFLTVFGFKLGR